MKLITKTIAASLPPALKAFKPNKTDVDKISAAMVDYFDRIDSKETEENLKTHLMDVFKQIYTPVHVVEQQGVVDFVIRSGGKGSNPAVLVEAKRASNRADMIRHEDINRKALHELVLYYMRQRSAGNTDIQHLVICTEHELYIFKAVEFERQFYRNTEFRKQYDAWNAGQKSGPSTDFFYREIAHPFIAQNPAEITAVYASLKNVKATLQKGAIDKAFVDFVKILSPIYLLNQSLRNDSNSLNKAFYDELLHLIGLEEIKKGSKRVIGRLKEGKRNAGSLLENTINQVRHENEFNSSAIIREYGNQVEERAFNIALELCLTWVNRLLFLKLLEAQIYRFHEKDESYKFLSHSMIGGFGPLSELFFQVLASNPADRSPHIQAKYNKVPYLNSSLFEQTALEASFKVSSLASDLEVPLFSTTILRDAAGRAQRGSKNALSYIFEFLDAYDFGSDGQNEVKLESKTIINASVLGLIFEKINGYRDGAIFTPGYITMYMARVSIEQMVLEAFRRAYADWKINDIGDLRNYLADDRSKPSVLGYNAIIDNLKICDPAVGSGHFLVSCLNELISLKSRLGILADSTGERLSNFSIDVDNDELIIRDASTNEIFAYQIKNGLVPKAIQEAQKTLFHEKQKLIENCLFGVDININSVHICQLRLWIELLKSAYYKDGIEGELETLPNIDINIKCGNSLLSRFDLQGDFSNAFSRAKLTVTEYRQLVNDYKTTKDKAIKRDLQEKIAIAKKRFQEEELERQNKFINSSIAVLRDVEAQEEMFGQDAAHEASRAKKLADIRTRISKLENVRRQNIWH